MAEAEEGNPTRTGEPAGQAGGWESEGEREPAGAALWQWWVVATTAGWALMGALAGALVYQTGDVRQYLFVPLSAIGQWLVLRRRFGWASLWLVATAAGTAVAALGYIALLSVPLAALGPRGSGARSGLSTMFDGVALGIAQWLVLRQTVRGASRWILATIAPLWFFGALALSQGAQTADVPLDLTLIQRIELMALSAGLQGLVLGTFTGMALVRLVREPRAVSRPR